MELIKGRCQKEFVLETLYAAWAGARHSPYIETHSICGILGLRLPTSGDVQ